MLLITVDYEIIYTNGSLSISAAFFGFLPSFNISLACHCQGKKTSQPASMYEVYLRVQLFGWRFELALNGFQI